MLRLIPLAALVIALPLLTAKSYLLGLGVVTGLFALVGIGLGLLMGHAGQVSLGHAAFYGIGAFTSGILTARHGWNPWLGLLAGLVLAAVVAYIVGLLTLRLQEHFLALATLGVGVIFYIFVGEATKLTGGPSGLVGIPGLAIGPWPLKSDLRFYLLVWTLVLAGLWVYQNVVASRTGLALRAVHGSEHAAAALGVDVRYQKLQVFVLSAVYAAAAGGLYAHYLGFISPAPVNFTASMEFLIVGVVGGLTSLWGPVLGALVVVVISEWLKEIVPHFIPSAGGEYQVMFYGLVLVLILIFLPGGLGGLVERLASSGRRIVLGRRGS